MIDFITDREFNPKFSGEVVNGLAVFTPSATIRISERISESDFPSPVACQPYSSCLSSGAGQHQIPNPGQAANVCGFAPSFNPQSSDLCKSPCNHRGPGIQTGSLPVNDPGRDSDDILHRAADFNPDDIVACIDLKRGEAKTC